LSQSEAILGLPDYQINQIEWKSGVVSISARYTGPICCPKCGGQQLRDKGRYQRRVRHENWGMRRAVLELEGHKWRCLECRRHFRQRSRDSGVAAQQRSLSQDDLSASPGRYQPELSGAPGGDRRRHRGTAFPARTPTPVRGVARPSMSDHSRHRRALFHQTKRLCHDSVRSEKPQNL